MKKLELTVASLICGLFLVAASTPTALANAELQILVGSTVVYDSGTLIGTSGASESYSSASGTTSFSLSYNWYNNSTPRSAPAPNSGIYLSITSMNSVLPVTLELSDNIVASGVQQLASIADESAVSQANTAFCTVSWYTSASNDLLAQTTLMGTTSFSPRYLYDSNYRLFESTGVPYYSLTEDLTVTGVLDGGGQMVVQQFRTPDDTMTVSMLGMAFFGLAAIRHRFHFE